MTVETTIQEMFDHYPLLYSTRKECLDHLFCTIGNGYEWKWGQLIYDDGNSLRDKDMHDADYAKPFHAKAHQSIKNIKARQKRNAVFEKAGITKSDDEHHWYPLSKEFSYLFHVPRNAKQDWKDAAEECKKMLEEDGIDWRLAHDK